IFGGYLASKMKADLFALSGEFEGGSVGAYVNYLHGGWMLSGVIKADFLDFDWQATSLGLQAKTDVTTVGGRIEAAYKHRFGDTGWIEPYANLTYAESSWDKFDVLATTFDLDGNNSLLGRIGLRVGADVKAANSTFKIFAGAGI